MILRMIQAINHTLIGLLSFFGGVFIVLTPAHAQMIQIFNGEDVNLGSWSPGDVFLINQQEVCVFKTGSFDSQWDATLTGDGPGRSFELSSVSGTLPITSVQLNGVEVTPNVLIPNNPGADISGFPDCNEFGRDNQSIRLMISTADLGSAPPGVYTGEIVIEARP